MFVVVSGPPGSGKSTLAKQLAVAMSLPLIAKDTIKEAICDVLAPQNVDDSRRLGAAAIHAMLALARANGTGVLDSVWHNQHALRQLTEFTQVVEVFCDCPIDVLRHRYDERAATRHPGHFDGDRFPEELWNEMTMSPIGGEWPLLRVATAEPVDIGELERRIRIAAR